MIPLRDLLHEIPSIVISAGDREKLLHGMDVNLITDNWENEIYRLIEEEGELVALAQRIQTFVSPVAQPVRWIRVHPRVTFG